MARFQIEDLLGKHKGVPAAICGHGPSLNKNKITPTIQEALQKAGKHISHYSTADTVAFHAIAFAILMGCNPIYLYVIKP